MTSGVANTPKNRKADHVSDGDQSMSTRYKDAIEAMADILKARAKIREKFNIIRRSLTVSEVTNPYGHFLDDELLSKTFDGSRVKGTKLLIDAAGHIQSKLTITDDIYVPLHDCVNDAPKVVIYHLCKEVGLVKILEQ